MVNNLPARIGDIRDVGSISGWERFPGEGHDNPLQYSCLENTMDRGAWWATVQWVAKIQTQLRRLSMHACYKKIGGVNSTEHELEINTPPPPQAAFLWLFPKFFHYYLGLPKWIGRYNVQVIFMNFTG